MSSAFRSLLAAALLIGLAAPVRAERVLKVCADPDNMPASNQRQEGFENALAQLLGQALHARVEYTWWAQRRSWAKYSINAGRCDVVLGVPVMFERVLATRPYYRSSYVF